MRFTKENSSMEWFMEVEPSQQQQKKEQKVGGKMVTQKNEYNFGFL